MIKIARLLLPVLFLLISSFGGTINAQTDHHDYEGHPHGGHSHEVGISLGITHLEHDNEFAPLIHLHYSKRLGSEGIWKHIGFGLGLETIIFEEMHYNVMGVMNIYPYGGFEISLSPGILYIEEDEKYASAFSFHAEAGYAFDFGFIEAGPVIGASFSGDDKHYSLGIHFGKGF